MVTNKRRRMVACVICGLLLIGGLAGCGSKVGTTDEKKMKVGIVQIVEHPALDEAKRGIVEALDKRGLSEKIVIDQQNAQGDQSNLRSIANRFVSGDYKVICAISTPAAQAMANATKKIPIVGTAISDYVIAKLMTSESSPDGNVTGTHDRGPLDKQVGLMRDIQPDLRTVGIIYNSSEVNSVIQVEQLKKTCAPLGIEVVERTVNSVNDVQQVAEGFLDGNIDAIFIPTDNIIASSIPTLMAVAHRGKIPVYGAEVGHVKNGVFASESISFYDIGYRAGEMAADILEGKKQVKDMPVEGAGKSKLYINKKEMEELGLTIPKEILDRAEML